MIVEEMGYCWEYKLICLATWIKALNYVSQQFKFQELFSRNKWEMHRNLATQILNTILLIITKIIKVL
jgi:hypothetical protein